MKKLIVLIFAVFLFACEKEQTYCWECTLYSSRDYTTILKVRNLCDRSDEEIVALEEEYLNLGMYYHCVKR
jgi:hypothetical protein